MTSSPPKPSISALAAGTIFATTIISGFIIGYGVDVWFDTQPVFMLLCAALSLVGGIFRVYKLLI